MDEKLKNVIWKSIERITFCNFEHLPADAIITVKKYKNLLIFIPRKAKAGEMEVQLIDYASSDIDFIALVDECCEDEYTAFIEVRGAYYEVPSIPVTKNDI